MTKPFKIILTVILILCVAGLWVTYSGYKRIENFASLDKYGAYLKKEFPEVEHISIHSLSTLIRSHEAGVDHLLLIDCRTPAEFQISHLKGALNLQTVEEVENFLKAQESPPANVVCYCSVGYRSGQLTENLQEKGLTGIKNVIGSIFSWANEDRPLIDSEGEPTEKVHPYNNFWAKHLKEGKAANIEM